MARTKLIFLQWAAWRQLMASRSRSGLSFMTAISILGVSLGVAALILVLSVMGGFEQDLKSKMLRGMPHLEVLAQRELLGFSLDKFPTSMWKEKLPNVTAIAPFVQTDVVLKQGKHLAAVNLIGVEKDTDTQMWAFHDSSIEGDLSKIFTMQEPLVSYDELSAALPGIVVGDSLAGQLGASLGDEIVILSPELTSSHSILSSAPLAKSFVLVGTFHSGLFNYDSKMAVVDLSQARKFMPAYDPGLDEENYVTGVAANLENPFEVNQSVEAIRGIEGISAKSWQDANSALLFALQLEKYTMGAILMLIVLVAAFSISGTMMMTVFHRKTQISLFQSLGMRRVDIGKLYLIQGMSVGGLGILIGLLLGLGACFFLEQARSIDMPADLMSLRSLPIRYLPVEYFVICSLALLLSMLGALYPAITAAKQNPSQGLRYS